MSQKISNATATIADYIPKLPSISERFSSFATVSDMVNSETGVNILPCRLAMVGM